MCDMIVKAWDYISEEMVRHAFLVCGQSRSSTPEDISCLKEGRVPHGVLEKVKKMWSKPFDAPLHITENDEEDIDELYRNEIVIEDNWLWFTKSFTNE